jgi:hypothetical protein
LLWKEEVVNLFVGGRRGEKRRKREVEMEREGEKKGERDVRSLSTLNKELGLLDSGTLSLELEDSLVEVLTREGELVGGVLRGGNGEGGSAGRGSEGGRGDEEGVGDEGRGEGEDRGCRREG